MSERSKVTKNKHGRFRLRGGSSMDDNKVIPQLGHLQSAIDHAKRLGATPAAKRPVVDHLDADQPAATNPNVNTGENPMTREQLTEKILDTKREKGWTWKYITEEIGGMSPVLIVGALLGQHKLVKPLAEKAGAMFELSTAEIRMLNEVPMRGMQQMPPTDPLIYRFYELVLVNGPAWKALIEEEFGDGIMSAIDFDMELARQPDPKGDRVQIAMTGKFLPYKYFGATQGIAPLGTKELDT